MTAPSPVRARVDLDAGRGPFARWPRAADAVLAAALLAASVLLQDGPGNTLVLRPLDELPLVGAVLLAGAGAALYWRRRAPLPVLAGVLAAWVLTLGQEHSDFGGYAIAAVYSTGRYADDGRWTHLGLAGAVVVLALDGVADVLPWGDVALGVVVMSVAWYAGRRLRLREQRRQAALREQQAEARRIVGEERARIARELHDVVAHRVSLMTVQAGAAKTVAADDPEAAVRAMGAVEVAGRQALDELRHLLGVLRPAGPLDGVGPQPCLADLPQLVQQTREAGLRVTLTTDGLPAGLPARVELSAYRIVQESLTNVLKHAGPDARTEVRVTSDGRCLVIDVSDDGRGATVLPGSRHGIIGMRERALLLGGSLDVGPGAGGGFRVLARLPLEGAAAP